MQCGRTGESASKKGGRTGRFRRWGTARLSSGVASFGVSAGVDSESAATCSLSPNTASRRTPMHHRCGGDCGRGQRRTHSYAQRRVRRCRLSVHQLQRRGGIGRRRRCPDPRLCSGCRLQHRRGPSHRPQGDDTGNRRRRRSAQAALGADGLGTTVTGRSERPRAQHVPEGPAEGRHSGPPPCLDRQLWRGRGPPAAA
jgi:hypothetical protein